jgi:hypothetical protein
MISIKALYKPYIRLLTYLPLSLNCSLPPLVIASGVCLSVRQLISDAHVVVVIF